MTLQLKKEENWRGGGGPEVLEKSIFANFMASVMALK